MDDSNRRIRANSKRARSRKGERNAGSEIGPPTRLVTQDKDAQPPKTPRVLTRNIVKNLTHGLDASDVLECYSLVRRAPLHGIADSSITVQKMAIGIRFRPSAADLKNPFNVKTPMELTLEYGPSRVGLALIDEATPIVRQDDDWYSSVTWDNDGKVYVTQKIVTEHFLSSHYMASMTGAVLEMLLFEAIKYTEQRKVYQPFSVYSNSGKRLLHSSSSADFNWYVWTHLAKLGVEIEPILPPAMYEARLYAKSVNKVFPDRDEVNAASAFYDQLYYCLESIATNNYGSSLFSKQQPAFDDDWNDDILGTTLPSDDDGNNRELGIKTEIDEDNYLENRLKRKIQEIESQEETEGIEGEGVEQPQGIEEAEGTKGEKNEDEKDIALEKHQITEGETFNETTVVDHDENNDDALETEATMISETTSQSPSSSSSIESDAQNFPETMPTITDAPSARPSSDRSGSLAPSVAPTKGIHDVEKAQNAANDAQKAADEAKLAAQTEGETKAADAAQAAAAAAAAAADATSSAASQAAMDSLLSGDGLMMASIVSTCFSNPQYNISSPDGNRTTPIRAYLLRDKSSYYKLELISPYLEVKKVDRPLPNAASIISDYGPGGNFLDWSLAMSIVFSLFLLILLICQQMGKRYISAIFDCQRWFFNPRHYDDDDNEKHGTSGAHFFFGKSGIPVSMGGTRSSYSPLQRKSLHKLMVDESFMDDDDDFVDQDSDSTPPNIPQGSRELEMVNFGSDKRAFQKQHSSSFGDSSQLSLELNEEEKIPDRLRRDPNLVELPTLQSKSKVATPVGIPANGNSPQGNQPKRRAERKKKGVTDYTKESARSTKEVTTEKRHRKNGKSRGRKQKPLSKAPSR